MSADPRLGPDGIDLSLQQATRASPSLAHVGQWRAGMLNRPEHAASTQLGGPQPSEQPSHTHVQESQRPVSTTPSSPRSSKQPPSRGNSQGPIAVHPHVPPDYPRPQPVPPNGVPATYSPQSEHAQHPPGPLGSSFPHGSLPPKMNASIKDSSDYRELSSAIQRAKPEVVRQVIREFWKRCLLGPDDHMVFILAAIFGHANDESLAQGVDKNDEAPTTSFKKIFIRTLKREIQRLEREDLDELADDIYAKASNNFLDRGMARRLETIPAQPLVNALARAERLGYNVGDIVEENTANGAEHVVPSFHPIPDPARPSQPVPSQSVSSHLIPSQPPSSQPIPSQHGIVGPTIPPQTYALQPKVLGTVRNLHSPAPAGPPGQYGIVHCGRCGRPCSGSDAFKFHSGRIACEHTHKVDRIGKDICPHCGSQFTSSGGLTYHLKSNVCGEYAEITLQTVLAELHAKFPPPDGARRSAPPPQPQYQPTPNARQTPTEQAGRTPVYTPAKGGAITPLNDPYANLTIEQRMNFDYEMQRAEEKYGKLMREASKLPPSERSEELQKLKNSFNSKQSVTRKKYGIRLRARRSQAEIEAERSRLWTAPSSRPNSDTTEHQQTQKRAFDSAEQGFSTHHPGHPDGGRDGSMPRKKQVLGDVSSGLPGASAAAERLDTRQSITPSTSRRGTQVSQPQEAAAKGTSDDPMQIDDSSGTEDSGFDSNEDIPARLPAQKG